MGLIKGAFTAVLVFTFMMAGANKVSDQVVNSWMIGARAREGGSGSLCGVAACLHLSL